MNNLKYFRELAGVPPKHLSKLLNVTVHTYIGYEQQKITIPDEIFLMIAKIYSIDSNEIFVPQENVTDSVRETLSYYSTLDEKARLELLCSNLTDGSKTALTYRDVRKAKNEIIEKQSDIKT